MKRVLLLAGVLGLLMAAPAQAYTKDQCDRMLMGASGAGWAPDNDVAAAWNYYESRGLDIVGATPGNVYSSGSGWIKVRWQFLRRSGHTEVSVGYCYTSGGVRHDVWTAHSL
jgi:hypothetical protein